jgi:hypothetical protein
MKKEKNFKSSYKVLLKKYIFVVVLKALKLNIKQLAKKRQ